MRKLAGIVLVLSLLGAIAPASAVADQFGLTNFRSRHYQVFTDLDMAKAKSLADHMDKVYEEYERRLAGAGFSGSSSPPMPLYLIATRDKYVKVLASMDVNGAGTAGMFFYTDGQARLAGWLTHNSISELTETLQHEGFHQFAFLKINHDLPTWVNEGLAVYFQQALLIRGRLVLNQVDPHRMNRVKKAVENGSYLHFEELLNMTGEEWVRRVNQRDSTASMMYDESWSIVHFLANAERGRFEQPFMQYLRFLHTGLDSRHAFIKAFGSDNYEPFEQAWKKYIADLGPDPMTLAVQRARFLAEGLAKLTAAGVKVETIDQLKTELKKINFAYTFTLENQRTTLSADDDANFEAPPTERGKASRWVLKASTNPALPPSLSIVGLQAMVNIDWSLDADKNLGYTLELR